MLGNVEPLAAAASSSKGGFNPSTLILILLVVAAFYLLMIRPQARRRQQAQQQQRDLLNSVQPGARVRTTAGMYATVVEVDDDDVVLEIAPGIEVRYMRRAIVDVVSDDEVDEETSLDDEAGVDETDEGFEESGEAEDVQGSADDAEPAAEDADETAHYEQPTGMKKD